MSAKSLITIRNEYKFWIRKVQSTNVSQDQRRYRENANVKYIEYRKAGGKLTHTQLMKWAIK